MTLKHEVSKATMRDCQGKGWISLCPYRDNIMRWSTHEIRQTSSKAPKTYSQVLEATCAYTMSDGCNKEEV